LNGQPTTIRGRIFILGLHALLTPALLLRSANESFPAGLGNGSGMVGRNLMFHVSDHLLVRFPEIHGPLNALLRHGISLNDFYFIDGMKLGTIQAHAADVGLDAQSFGSEGSDGTAVFHTVVEDFPYLENRVTPTAGSNYDVSWQYTYPEELRVRSQTLVRSFCDALGKTGDVKVSSPTGMLNGTHACGTCCFGLDPRTSVLDRDNRVHDLDNLYVVDASFFPSSGGMNPSLTIVANSLRVSSRIAQR
jgi:choline dehydrogenase-like flavoprotein